MAQGTKDPLLTLLEFNEYFSIPFQNGVQSEPWPNKTVLLFRYRTEQSGVSTWLREDNTPESPGIAKMHAELKMIDFLKKIILSVSSIDMIEVIQNYSPCSECSKKLCSFKEELDKKFNQRKNKERKMKALDSTFPDMESLILKGDTIEFKITFSYFYRWYTDTDDNANSEGIKNLINSDIKLEILTHDKWQYVFEETGLLYERKKRESAVKKLLDNLENEAKREKA